MKIKELRQITGLSQAQFAKKFHIPVNTVRGWEQEKRSPPEYVPGMIEEIIREEQQPIKGQLTLNYNPMTDDEILKDDAEAEPKTEPERHKILTYMKASLMDMELEDIYCDNCIYGAKCQYNYKECENYRKTNYTECKNIENWIYWEDFERMIEE